MSISPFAERSNWCGWEKPGQNLTVLEELTCGDSAKLDASRRLSWYRILCTPVDNAPNYIHMYRESEQGL